MEEKISESHHNVTYDDTHYLGKMYLDKVTDQFKVHNNDPQFKDLQDESLDENVKKRWNVLHFLVRQQNLLQTYLIQINFLNMQVTITYSLCLA